MMRIVYITKSMAPVGGLERVVCDKMNYLVGHGYDVTLITYEQGDHPFAYPVDSRINHYDLDVRFFLLYRYPLWKRLYYYRQYRSIFKERLQRTIDCVKPDVVIANTYSMNVADIIANLQTTAYRILESHVAFYIMRKTDSYRKIPLMRWLANIYDWHTGVAVRKFDKVVTLTKGDAKDWLMLTDRVEVIPNPVTSFPDEVITHDGSGRRIIAVGRLHEQKGFDRLINAFAMVANHCPEWHIDIYGSGDDEKMLFDIIHNNGLDGKVNIFPPTNQIYEEYQKSEFFVLSSRYEGYPLVLNEAMACGIPCVAFRCKYGPEEAIEHQVNGLLVENGNVKDLAQKILWMTNHPEERKTMGQAARVAAQRYLLDTIMQKWVDLFSSLTKTGE